MRANTELLDAYLAAKGRKTNDAAVRVSGSPVMAPNARCYAAVNNSCRTQGPERASKAVLEAWPAGAAQSPRHSRRVSPQAWPPARRSAASTTPFRPLSLHAAAKGTPSTGLKLPLSPQLERRWAAVPTAGQSSILDSRPPPCKDVLASVERHMQRFQLGPALAHVPMQPPSVARPSAGQLASTSHAATTALARSTAQSRWVVCCAQRERAAAQHIHTEAPRLACSQTERGSVYD